MAHLYGSHEFLELFLVEDIFLNNDGFHEDYSFWISLLHDVKVTDIRVVAFLYQLKIIWIDLTSREKTI
jgi:hypothetical protein